MQNVDLPYIEAHLANLKFLNEARLKDISANAFTPELRVEQTPPLDQISILHFKLEGLFRMDALLDTILARFPSLQSLSFKFDEGEMFENFERFLATPQGTELQQRCHLRALVEREELDIWPLMGRHRNFYLSHFIPRAVRNADFNNYLNRFDDDDDEEMDQDYEPPVEEME